MIGLAVVVGYYTFVQKKAAPIDVFQVSQPAAFSFTDKFGDGSIAKGKWNVNKAAGVTVNETQADNLRIVIPNGAVAGKAASGVLVYKEAVADDKDFAVIARMFKPDVAGAGAGRVGIRFAGGEGADAEGVTLYWEQNGSTNELVFQVSAGGAVVRTQKIPVTGNQVQLALRRTGTEYSALYRVDNFDDDNAFIEVGEPVTSSGTTAGRIRLFASNVGTNNAYPKVVGRFDSVSLKSNTSYQLLSDNFAADGSMDSGKWAVSTKGVAGTLGKTGGNLTMTVPSATKPAASEFAPNAVRATSNADVAKDTRGVAVVELFKPKATGAGSAITGLSFNSESDKNDESASVRWVVTGNSSSKLVFVVRNASGKVVERASANLPNGKGRVTVRLVHGDGTYTATYRVGPGLDDDSNFKMLGSEKNPKLGAKGSFGIFATHDNSGTTAPEVVGKFDSFRVLYY